MLPVILQPMKELTSARFFRVRNDPCSEDKFAVILRQLLPFSTGFSLARGRCKQPATMANSVPMPSRDMKALG